MGRKPRLHPPKSELFAIDKFSSSPPSSILPPPPFPSPCPHPPPLFFPLLPSWDDPVQVTGRQNPVTNSSSYLLHPMVIFIKTNLARSEVPEVQKLMSFCREPWATKSSLFPMNKTRNKSRSDKCSVIVHNNIGEASLFLQIFLWP